MMIALLFSPSSHSRRSCVLDAKGEGAAEQEECQARLRAGRAAGGRRTIFLSSSRARSQTPTRPSSSPPPAPRRSAWPAIRKAPQDSRPWRRRQRCARQYEHELISFALLLFSLVVLLLRLSPSLGLLRRGCSSQQISTRPAGIGSSAVPRHPDRASSLVIVLCPRSCVVLLGGSLQISGCEVGHDFLCARPEHLPHLTQCDSIDGLAQHCARRRHHERPAGGFGVSHDAAAGAVGGARALSQRRDSTIVSFAGALGTFAST